MMNSVKKLEEEEEEKNRIKFFFVILFSLLHPQVRSLFGRLLNNQN
jgi:hypothetical protein